MKGFYKKKINKIHDKKVASFINIRKGGLKITQLDEMFRQCL